MASGYESYDRVVQIAPSVRSVTLSCRSLFGVVAMSVVLLAGLLLAGCDTDQIGLAVNAKANQPVPAKLLADMSEKDMDLQSPILVRLFKQEAELEVWKQNRSGRYALLKTYPICRWSGDLGPKVREGDRQAPEGFYAITPGQMNPQSAYYLSFNIGYPNAYDKALGHTGSQLMVHGDCSSRGCYAMTDEQIAEIYALGRESFFGGQTAFQVQAYPFRMTPLNMAKHRNNPNMAFWKMIKEGYDHFEVTRQEPKVDFCEKKYVFDATKPPDAKKDAVFNAAAKCPAYVIPDEIADAVREKQEQDQAETNKLIEKGTPVARINTGIDGGMNKVFASKIPDGNTGLSEAPDGPTLSLAATRAPGTIPATVNPPHGPVTSPEEPLAASIGTDQARVASAAPSAPSEGGFFSSLARAVGIGGGADTSTTAAAPAAAPAKPPAKTKLAEAKHRPALRPSVAEPPQPATAAAAPEPTAAVASAPAPTQGQVAGSQPIMQANSFESRFSAVK